MQVNLKYLTTLAVSSVLIIAGGYLATESLQSAQANPCAAVNSSSEITSTANAAPQTYADTRGLAIRGADPVAYFTEGKALLGNSQYQYEWNGATWQFTSAENRDRFASNPEAFAPQYGGYCAQAVSGGYLASIDPNAWKIVDNKLYLNYSPDVQQQWMTDISGNIAKGDANWPAVLNTGRVYE